MENYILSDDNFPQFEKLFEVLKALLNENNMNFILVELNLLKIISNNKHYIMIFKIISKYSMREI